MAGKHHLFKLPLLLFSMSLTACGMDLGTFSESDDLSVYYDAFGDLEGLYDGGDESYDFEDSLFNEYTLEKFEWEDSGDAVESQEYLYLIIPFKEDLTIETLAFFIYTDVNVAIELNFFYYAPDASRPSKIRYLTSPTEEYNDDTEQYEPIEYDDPDVSTSICTIKGNIVKEEWNSFACEGFNQPDYDDGCLHAQDDGYLYIRMENNSGFNTETMTHFSFKFINFIIRAI